MHDTKGVFRQRYTLRVLTLLVCTIPLFACTGCSDIADLFSEKDLTKIPLEQVLNNGKPTLADFGWRDCEPCKNMKIVLERLASRYRGRVNVIIIEAYNHPDLMKKYAINAIPAQIIFDSNGEEITRHEGFWPEKEIAAELAKAGLN